MKKDDKKTTNDDLMQQVDAMLEVSSDKHESNKQRNIIAAGIAVFIIVFFIVLGTL